MSKYDALVVVLEDNINEEQKERLAGAVMLIRGVLTVVPHEVEVINDHIAEQRVRAEIHKKLYEALGR